MDRHKLLMLMVCVVGGSSLASVPCGPDKRCTCQQKNNQTKEINCFDPLVKLVDVCAYVKRLNIKIVNYRSLKLTVLKSSDLVGCEEVLTMSVQQSTLSEITVDAFKDLNKLETLDLRYNKLQQLYIQGEPSRFEHLPNLKSLFINGNIMNDTKGGTYPRLASLVSLTVLFMDSIVNAKFGNEFKRLKNLSEVSLSGFEGFCDLGRVTNDTFEGLESVVVLNISSCNLTGFEAGALLPLKHLEKLDMSCNMRVGFAVLPNVSFGLQYTKIKVLKYTKMFPTFGIGTMVTKKHLCFLWNTSLEMLDISSNRIQLYETNALILLPLTLKVWKHEDNYFTFGPYFTQTGCASNVIEYYANMEFTSHSPLLYDLQPDLQKFDETEYDLNCPFMEDSFLKNISLLKPDCLFQHGHDINWTYFLSIPKSVKKLEYRKSRNEYVIPYMNFFANNLEYLDISGNLFYSWIGPVGPFSFLTHLDLSNNYCSYIGEHFFLHMPMLENLQIQNNLIGLFTLKDETFSPLRALKTINLSSNRLCSLPDKIFSHLTNLESIDLSNNVLQIIDFDYIKLSNLTILNVSQNAIRHLSHNLLQHMLDVSVRRGVPFQMDLSRNVLPFNCLCITFLNFLLKYHEHFANIDSYVFEDDKTNLIHGYNLEKAVRNLEKECAPYDYIIAACCTGLSIFFTVVIGGMVYKHRWKLRFIMHMAKRKYLGKNQLAIEESEGPNEIGNIFDAFISYAEEDVDFIRTGIIPQLESNGFSLCIHQRDFLAGKPIADNIVDAIKTSKKTVAVISKNYVRQRWCLYEFQMARMESIYYRNNCLLLILLHAVPLDLMPLEMIEWMDKESYLEYTDDVHGNDVFWDRLKTYVKEAAN